MGILDLDAGRARATAERLGREHGARTAGEAADVADEAAVKAGIAAIVRELGEVDILVNNAGMDTTSRVEDMPTEMFDRMIAVHLRGTFLCTREVCRRCGAGAGAGSSTSPPSSPTRAGPTMAHYVAAKAGIMGFTRSLAYEVARDGITVELPEPWADRHAAARGPAAGMARHEDQGAADRPLRPARGGGAGGAPARQRGGSYFVGASLNMNGGDVMV